MSVHTKRSWIFTLPILIALVLGVCFPSLDAFADTTILVDNLQPSWTAPGGGGVYSVYYGPPSYNPVSPGLVAFKDGREAAPVYAGVTVDPLSGNYEDQGLLAFKPGDVPISTFAANVLTYDFENEYGTHPVWVYIELNKDILGDIIYQYVPTSNPAGWHTEDAGTGTHWQAWTDLVNGIPTGPMLSLSDIAALDPTKTVSRVYLTMGMGNSYHSTPNGTVAWVDKVTIGSVTYDFVLPTYWYVDPTGSDSNEGTLASPFLTIQHAVDMAVGGDTIHIAAGTYEEQVEITESLTLLGAGPTTIIKSPVTLTKYFATSANNFPIVYIHNTTGVVLQDLRVDGAGRGNTNYRFVGIGFNNAGGTIDTVEVVDIRDTPFSGAQHGVGILSWNDDATSRTINVWDCDITGFQKNAMALNASDTNPLVVDVQGNTITGAGTTTITAQNGIQVWADSGTGLVNDNDISGIAYDGSGWVATSILNYYGDMDITNNTISGSHMGIYNIEGAGDITGNSLGILEAAGYAYGIVATDPPDALPSPITEYSGQLRQETSEGIQALDAMSSVLTVNVSNNILAFSGPDNTGSVGIEADAGYGPDDLSVSVDSNTVSGFEVGIGFWKGTSSTGVFTSLDANYNCLSGNTYGIYTNETTVITDGTNNWWGDATGPYHSTNPTGLGDEVSDYVTFTPWLNACGGASTANFQNVDTLEYYATLQAAVSDALPGETVIPLTPGPWPGTTTITTNGVTIDLSGATFTGGSSALVISADDVTVMGPGVYDGSGDTEPAIVVNAGADNFILDGVEIKGWTDGVWVKGAVESLKIVNNWIHSNSDDGLQVDAAPSGVVTIEGNLFKVNGDVGVEYGGTGNLDATYNSWGDDAGPTGTNGDGVGAGVTYEPWTFSEIYFDLDPDTSGDQYTRHVFQTQSFDVAIMGDAENLYGLSFAFSYEPSELTYNSVTFYAPWTSGNCDPILPPLGAGEIGYFCSLSDPDVEWDGGMIAKFNFTATVAADSFFDVFTDVTLSSGAVGGVKVFVNNAGYNAPSSSSRDITDGDDGHIYIDLSNFTGFIDLQGRPNDSGALLEVWTTNSGGTKLASATSASSGKYTTVHETGQMMVLATPYYLFADRALYLPTHPTYPPAQLLLSPTTALNMLVLLGGDGFDDNDIDIADASCIGSAYGTSNNNCTGTGSGPGANSDVNGDGIVNIYDLTLMGGNFSKTYSPWTPQ